MSLLPWLEQITNHVSELTARNDIRWIVFIGTQGPLWTGHLPQVVALPFRIALAAVGHGVQLTEAPLAGEFPILKVVRVKVQEPVAVQHSQGQIHWQGSCGRDVPVYVSISVVQGRSLGLLESELDQEFEEVLSRIVPPPHTDARALRNTDKHTDGQQKATDYTYEHHYQGC